MKLKNLIAGACALCGFALSAQADDGKSIEELLRDVAQEWKAEHVRDFPSDFRPGDALATGIYKITGNITVDASGLPGTSAIAR